MRTGIVALVATLYCFFTVPALCQKPQPSVPLSSALKFFDAFASRDIHSALRALQRVPISVEERERAQATLPVDGALTPTRDEVKKLDALKPILIYHERDQVFDIKVIDVPQAFIGLHERAILLISRPAVLVLTASELQALAAHEIAHDFLWREFEQGQQGGARQQLELECDGIAGLTLLALGLDPMQLLMATKKVNQFNEQFGTPSNITDYPTSHDRQRFLIALLRRQNARRVRSSAERGSTKTSCVIDP